MVPRSLIIVRGLPGSGKSSFAQLLSALPLSRAVAADDFPGRYENGDIAWVVEPHDWCKQRVEEYLKAGLSVVIVHNTFVRRAQILPYARLARLYGYRLYVVRMEGNFGSEHNVPEDVLARMMENWEDWDELELERQGAFEAVDRIREVVGNVEELRR